MDICGRGMREESLQTSAWEATCGLARAAKGLFTWENTHWLEFHTDMTSWFHAAFICLHVFSSSHDQHDNAILKWWKLCMHFLFQSASRSISHQKDVVVRVYMILLQNFVPEWNSCSTTTTTTHTGVTCASMTFCSNRMVSCKQIQSYKREPELTCAGAYVAPVSC